VSIRERIEEKLRKNLQPEYMELKNISHLHAGHAGHDGTGDSHFRLTVVSQKFAGLSRIERHRMIYNFLDDEFKDSLHALSINAHTPGEESFGKP